MQTVRDMGISLLVPPAPEARRPDRFSVPPSGDVYRGGLHGPGRSRNGPAIRRGGGSAALGSTAAERNLNRITFVFALMWIFTVLALPFLME